MAAAVLLAGCATTPEMRVARLQPLRLALQAPPETLRIRAEGNDGSAQLALSILYQFGRSGLERDPAQAKAWLVKAMASRGSTPITTYVAGVRGKPGRVQTIFVPRYDISPGQAASNLACARALEQGDRSAKGVEPCGGEDSYDQLAVVWRTRA